MMILDEKNEGDSEVGMLNSRYSTEHRVIGEKSQRGESDPKLQMRLVTYGAACIVSFAQMWRMFEIFYVDSLQ